MGQTQFINTLIDSRASTTPICLKCGHDKAARRGLDSGSPRYHCATCKITFNALTGTLLSRLRHKDKWLEYAQQMTEGNSVSKKRYSL